MYLRPGSDPLAVRADLMSSLGERHRVFIHTNASLRAEVLRIFDSTFAITYALEAIAIFVAILGVSGTLVTLILERRRELTTLRLVGADRGQIRRMVVIEAGMIGVVSQVLGWVAGLGLALILIYVINVQSFGWTIQFHVPGLFLLQSSLALVRRDGACRAVSGATRGRRAADGAPRGMMHVRSLLCRVACGVFCRRGRSPSSTPPWRNAEPGRVLRLPADHASHPEYRIEWWYYTGNLHVDDGRRFGYQLTFFRVGVDPAPANPSRWAVRDLFMAHVAVTDVGGRRHQVVEQLSRPGVGWAGARTDGYHVWNDDWSVRSQNGRHRLLPHQRRRGSRSTCRSRKASRRRSMASAASARRDRRRATPRTTTR